MIERPRLPTGDSAFWKMVNAARPLRDHPWLGDAFGIGMFAVALALRFALDPVWPVGFPFLTFFPAVILTTFLCGLRPGIACAVLSTLAAWYFFIGPASDMVLNGQNALALGFFISISAIDIVLIHFTFNAAELLREEQAVTARLYENQRVMFQELQHRVANNMQFVASLLTLHRRRALADPTTAISALDEARARLDTISRVHRRLYDPDRLDLPVEFYLRELCADLLEASGTDCVICEVEAPPITFNVTRLTTLSLLVAEIVTNSLKHAFEPDQPGTIAITISALGTGRYELVIADNGRGMPANYDPTTATRLGFRIIQSLAAQLGGKLRYESGNGMAVHVEFVVE